MCSVIFLEIIYCTIQYLCINDILIYRDNRERRKSKKKLHIDIAKLVNSFNVSSTFKLSNSHNHKVIYLFSKMMVSNQLW